MTKPQSCLMRYYDFAEKCDDDLEVMAKAIELHGCKYKNEKINTHFENYTMDSKNTFYYDTIIKEVSLETIKKAFALIERERSRRLSLFGDEDARD